MLLPSLRTIDQLQLEKKRKQDFQKLIELNTEIHARCAAQVTSATRSGACTASRSSCSRTSSASRTGSWSSCPPRTTSSRASSSSRCRSPGARTPRHGRRVQELRDRAHAVERLLTALRLFTLVDDHAPELREAPHAFGRTRSLRRRGRGTRRPRDVAHAIERDCSRRSCSEEA